MSLSHAPALHLGFASLHVLLGHVGQGFVYRLRFGRSPMALYRGGTHDHARWSRFVAVASLLWTAALVATAVAPAWRAHPLGRPLCAPPAALGWSVALGGLCLMLVAQYTMGAHFRIGQHEADAPDSLRTTGLLARSRNPVYVGSWSCLVGMTLWHPNAALLVTCALTGVGIHGLVLAEERFLARRFGEAFRLWCARVPRYVGRRR